MEFGELRREKEEKNDNQTAKSLLKFVSVLTVTYLWSLFFV